MVKMIPLTCPSCGATLEVRNDTKTCFCTYCGTKLLIDDGSKTVTINKNVNINNTNTYVDQAELEKIKLQQEQWKEVSKFHWKPIIIFALMPVYIAVAHWLIQFFL